MSRHASNNAIRGVLILAGSERVLLGERSALLPDSEAIEGMVLERFAAVGQDRLRLPNGLVPDCEPQPSWPAVRMLERGRLRPIAIGGIIA